MSGDRVAPLIVGRKGRGYGSRLRLLDPATISVNWGPTTSLVQWCDLVMARSVRNHTEIATTAGVVKAPCPLKEVVEILASLGLVQLRRNLAVNTARVCRLVGAGHHRLFVVLDDGRYLQVGRNFQRVVRARFGAQSMGHPRTAGTLPSLRMPPLKKRAGGA
jgi:DNA-binding LytR/AlgR family response regulator